MAKGDLAGNRWKTIDLPEKVTAETVLEFVFGIRSVGALQRPTDAT